MPNENEKEKKLRAFLTQNQNEKEPIRLRFSKAKTAKLRSGGQVSNPDDLSGTTVGGLYATFSVPAPEKGKFKAAKKALRADKTLLPDSWRNDVVPVPKDEADKEKYYKKVDLNPEKYKLATRPQAQKKCGSCFAFACATTISDAFVFGKNLPYNPLNSPLDILSCVNDDSNAKCGGGHPIGVLTYLAEHKGITGSNCMSYDNWVAGNKLTSEAVPDCSGCYVKQCDPKPKRNRYQIKAPTFISSSDATASDSSNIEGVGDSAVYEIKLHLLQYGSAVVGFPVLNNFLNDPDGSFHETNGIYFENKVYEAGKNDGESTKGAEHKKGDDPFVCAGGHAVCITGWGVSAKPITLYFPNDIDPNKKKITIENCPYWVVRNSWGREWGDGGYFKMAMYQKIIQDGVEYEINPNVAFERFRVYQARMIEKYKDEEGKEKEKITVQEMPIGGVILIEPADIVPDTQEPRDVPSYTDEDMKRFYCSDTELLPKEKESEKKDEGKKDDKKDDSQKKNGMSDTKLKISNLGKNKADENGSSSNFWWFLFIVLVLSAGYYLYVKRFKR